MDTLLNIYQLRSELEDGGAALNNQGGILAYFLAANIAAITRASAGSDYGQARPRAEIRCTLGAANGHRFVCPDNIARYDRWRMTLAVRCVTIPAGDGNNEINEAFVGGVKAICSTIAQQTWTDLINFPNVRIAEPLREAGDSSALRPESGDESTTINYTGTLCVRESAWP